MKKSQKLRIQAIQKEQIQLVQIEKTLESLLTDIKESINTMKVEELQLKSSLVEHFTNPHSEEQRPTTSAVVNKADTVIPSTSSNLMWLNDSQVTPVEAEAATSGFLDETINKQLLDLETLLVPMKSRKFSDYDDEEEEEEEEDDDDNEEIANNERNHGFNEDDLEFLPETL